MSQTLTYHRARSGRRSRSYRRALRWRMATTPAVAAMIVLLGTVGLDLVVDPPADDYVVEPVVPAPAPVPAGPTDQQLVAAATAAVGAWGDFATTGDLAAVAGTFVVDGPQHRQLAQEAPARQAAQGGAPYRFVVSGATVLDQRPDGDRVVRADLELVRDGSPVQRYRWDLRLRADPAGAWRIWTVSEAAG